MKVLMISMHPIHPANSVGNTFLNLFEGMSDVEIYSLCIGGGLPAPTVRGAYACTEKEIFWHYLRRTPVGGVVAARNSTAAQISDSRLMRLAKTLQWTVLYLLRDAVWCLPAWKNASLKSFLQEVQPDMLFSTVGNSVALQTVIRYIAKETGKPLLLYAWDDTYSYKMLALSPLRWLYRCINRAQMRKTVRAADKLYVISELQKKEYEKAFSIPCTLPTKSANFSEIPPPYPDSHSPLQLVFTGNIGTNRWKSLSYIVKALRRLQADGIQAQLRIYTATPITPRIRRALSAAGIADLMGSAPAADIPRIQAAADILVHAEAFDLKNRLLVRASFSTKLVDYFQAARPIFAVGATGTASIAHLLQHDAAVVAVKKQEVLPQLSALLRDASLRRRYAQNAYACGRKLHAAERLQNMLHEDMRSLL